MFVYLSHMRAAKAQTCLLKDTGTPEPLMLAHNNLKRPRVLLEEDFRPWMLKSLHVQ